jgi:glycosyltransferase involved in cell wall biosynthesis
MRSLLVLNFFPAFVPPRSGGEQRYYRLYEALSRFYDVTLLSPTYPDHPPELVAFGPSFREHRIPKERLHVRLHERLDKDGLGPECSALVCALASADEDAYRRKYRELVADVDAVIHESPYMVNCDEEFGRDGKPRVYSSYNVEGQLAADMFPGPRGRRYVEFITDLERQLVGGCELVFATSEIERRTFRDHYGCPEDKLALAPNGFHPRPPAPLDPGAASAYKQRFRMDPGRPMAIFVGSAHPPNIEAARFISDRVAGALPRVQFAIVGSVCPALTSRRRNVHLLGVLDEDDKARLYQACDVGLNPVVSGAGTNLKLLDYMGAGIAVVTTPFGARGIPVEHGQHCLLAERDAFTTVIEKLLADRGQQARIGRAAAELVYTHFTWTAVAAAVRTHLDGLFRSRRRAGKTRRARLLLLNDFPVSAPVHGGQVRIHQLFKRLSLHYEVTLLCLCNDEAGGEVRIAEHFTEVRVPKTSAHRAEEREWNSCHRVSTSDILTSAVCVENPELVAHYRRLLRRSDLVIFEHPYLAALLEVERPTVPVFYEAHNVESAMKARTLRGHADRSQLLQLIDRVEGGACAVADRVVCVSHEDRDLFAQRVDPTKLVLVRNGVDTKPYFRGEKRCEDIRRSPQGRAVAVFMGSAHPPNLEAVRFIVEELAPRHPAVAFVILGASCERFRHHLLPSNVLLCGVVSDEGKEVLLQVADVAINPMVSGGGSSLKVAEYLAAGLPVLSTEVGLRGYDLDPREHAEVADLGAFSERLTALLNDPGRRAQLEVNGQLEARTHLDWDVLAGAYREIIEGVRSRRGKRLLVTTFRFTDPPLGGAETYLLEVLKRLHASGRFVIDVATFDVAGITNHLHFSARYDPGDHATPGYVNRVHGFAPEPVRRRELLERCQRLFTIWQEEDLVQGRRFVERFTDVVLLGGWYVPEPRGGGLARWTAACAEIYCPAHVQALTVSGLGHAKTPLTVASQERVLRSEIVSGEFSLCVDLRGLPATVVQLRTPVAVRGDDDPRPLGVCISDITQLSETGTHRVPLDRDFSAVLRRSDAETWVASLIEATRQRAAVDDSLFLSVRGPSSRAFEQWLRTSLAGYDAVLAHGVPFAPVVITATQARRLGIPYAVLPHFHFDDKYYHWQSYYEAFADADIVFASPDGSKAHFFDKIDAPALCIPGGGVNPHEFDDLESPVREFRRLHTSARPYVLVLGRKAGGKRYERVIRAVDALRAHGQACDVVMIGPDEDSLPITSVSVAYYGNQPRNVVLGALACCTTLATMSESESFGIVAVEAWMCKKPVIANRDCPAFAELIDHEDDGLLCGTDDELAMAISRMLLDSALRQQFGERGYAKARSRFTWNQIGETIGTAMLSIAR